MTVAVVGRAVDDSELPAVGTSTGLHRGRLGLAEIISQSVANISPTFTPALNIVVVMNLAGPATWLAYLVATLGMLLIATNIAGLARRHPLAGSYFVYIGRSLGPGMGVLAGWIVIGTYICTATTVIIGSAIFLADLLAALGLTRLMPPAWLFELLFGAAVGWSGIREVRFSSRVGLLLEGASLVIIVVVIALAVTATGRIGDPQQLTLTADRFGPVATALTFAVFSFVGFESAATLAREARDPQRTVPRALLLSVLASGIFFVVCAYCIRLVVGDTRLDANPFTAMTVRANIGWTAALIYFGALISAFACTLASVNAAARLMFSMGRFGVIHHRVGQVHPRHGTPHVAVTVSVGLATALALAVLPCGLIEGYTYTATITAFGFLSIYLLISVAAPIDARLSGARWRASALAGIVSVILITFVVLGNLYPTPAFPLDLLPLIFCGYVAVGIILCLVMRARAPDRLALLQSDMEG